MTPPPARPATAPASDGERPPALRVSRPLVSLVLPAYNEGGILTRNLGRLFEYLDGLDESYDFEVFLVDDGSLDDTGVLARRFAEEEPRMRVIEHPANLGLGNALRSGFNASTGDFVITLDLDLSYEPSHIERLLTEIRTSRARIVMASPYAEGGSTANIPRFRRWLSVWANRFLALSVHGKLTAVTGICRVYDGPFIRSLNLKSQGMEVNTEIIYKASVMRAIATEIPARLEWEKEPLASGERRSHMRVFWNTVLVLFLGYLFRPFLYFLVPGAALLVLSLYVNTWAFLHFLDQYAVADAQLGFFDRGSAAVAEAYAASPHTFVIGGLSLMLAIQLMSIGVQTLQSKRYFEENFHLGSSIFRHLKRNDRESS